MDNNNGGEENAPKQQQQIAILQQGEDEDGISVPNWLLEVLASISRIEMANSSLSYSCKLFKQLCWPKLHENVKPFKIERLELLWDSNSKSTFLELNRRYDRQLPIPNVPPPTYILGFQRIEIHFLDDLFVEFVQNIFPLLNSIEFLLDFESDRWMGNGKMIEAIERFLDLLADKIVKFTFSGQFFELGLVLPGFFQKVHYLRVYPDPTPAEFGILFSWLEMPPTNAHKQQKIFQFRHQLDQYEANELIDQIKEEFSNASDLLNFYIMCPFGFPIAHFNMENGKTGETLTLTEQMQILRCPKGEENRWNEEGQNKTDPEWIGHADETHIDYSISYGNDD